MYARWACALGALLLAGCGSMNATLNGTTEVVEYFRVFDLKTSAPATKVIAAARDGLARNTSNISDYRPVTGGGPVPEQPGRFSTVNPLQNSNLGALMGAQANMMRRATCEGAVWMANATRGGNTTVQDSFATISVCLWQYANGYHLDLYANMSAKKGGIGLDAASRAIAHGIVGTPEEWIETTFNTVARQVGKSTGANISLVDAYPEPQGEPWLCGSGDAC